MSTVPEFHRFLSDVSSLEIPDTFTYPFNYTPHPIAVAACEELKQHIHSIEDLRWFFDKKNPEGFGKMFGILVVQSRQNELGYLAAFSGKLIQSNHWRGFVPPVFDMLKKDGYFKQEEQNIYAINQEIDTLSSSHEYQHLIENLETTQSQYQIELSQFKQSQTNAKQSRQQSRVHAKEELNSEEYTQYIQKLDKESADMHYELKRLKQSFKEKISILESEIHRYQAHIQLLKEERKARSQKLQDRLFESYTFFNALGESRSLVDIFQTDKGIVPPSGAGECCAPKLLQYAYLYELTPIALAEFWYGKSPQSEIRTHGNFYPSCRSKCYPILSHMMQGLAVEANTMLIRLAADKHIEIIYEDEDILVINKPQDFLSVPGGEIRDSVYQRIHEMYPLASGPLIVHRLDMSTSGLMLIALHKTAHYHLQRQFETKTIQKRYVAILDGAVASEQGTITLPLRVDLEDRPRQLVDFDYGKSATTHYEIISRTSQETRVHFYPITGRTHQLRLHAAHVLGLGTPIKGDDLYGTRSDRLYLHAEEIAFLHPMTEQRMQFLAKADF